jgi:hypothetical protein
LSYSRRSMVISIFGATVGLAAGAPFYSAQQRSPQPMPSPNAPNPNFPPGLDGPDQKQPDKKQMDRQNQAEVKAGVEKLYQLISELRGYGRFAGPGRTRSVVATPEPSSTE